MTERASFFIVHENKYTKPEGKLETFKVSLFPKSKGLFKVVLQGIL